MNQNWSFLKMTTGRPLAAEARRCLLKDLKHTLMGVSCTTNDAGKQCISLQMVRISTEYGMDLGVNSMTRTSLWSASSKCGLNISGNCPSFRAPIGAECLRR